MIPVGHRPPEPSSRNGNGGVCVRCGRHVAVNAGVVRRPTEAERAAWQPQNTSRRPLGRQLKWVTQHDECRDTYEGSLVHWRYNPVGAK